MPPPKAKKPRLSKLAKENNISADEEAEIKEAFHLFSAPPGSDDEEFASEKEGVIKTQDVRRALMYVPASQSTAALRSSLI
jgi:hypothetical protein